MNTMHDRQKQIVCLLTKQNNYWIRFYQGPETDLN